MDTENRLTAVRGKGDWGLGEKSEGIKEVKSILKMKINEKILC